VVPGMGRGMMDESMMAMTKIPMAPKPMSQRTKGDEAREPVRGAWG